MAGFSIPIAMNVFYELLRQDGFEMQGGATPMPDEWLHLATGMQVKIVHVAGSCEIRYRRKPGPLGSHAVSKDLEHDRMHPWNLISRPHGDSNMAFVDWLTRAAGTIRAQVAAVGLTG